MECLHKRPAHLFIFAWTISTIKQRWIHSEVARRSWPRNGAHENFFKPSDSRATNMTNCEP